MDLANIEDNGKEVNCNDWSVDLFDFNINELVNGDNTENNEMDLSALSMNKEIVRYPDGYEHLLPLTLSMPVMPLPISISLGIVDRKDLSQLVLSIEESTSPSVNLHLDEEDSQCLEYNEIMTILNKPLKTCTNLNRHTLMKKEMEITITSSTTTANTLPKPWTSKNIPQEIKVSEIRQSFIIHKPTVIRRSIALNGRC